MLAIGIRFIAGRYHANPWGRHVNEADIEWPPSPWRICRALVATWYHKVEHKEFPLERLEALIDRLCENRPAYRLPPAVHSHTRHYMPQYRDRDKPSLVFDAFARVDRSDELIIAWQDLELSDNDALLLDELLARLNYLGRAESWVEAHRLDEGVNPVDFTCFPDKQAIDMETGEIKGETITLFALLAAETYARWREGFEREELLSMKAGRKKNQLASTIPETLARALTVDTAEYQKSGWSRPPAGEPVLYIRPLDALKVNLRKPYQENMMRPTTARFILIGKPLPRIEDAVRIGEWFRMAITGKANKLFGDKSIPSELSGHGLPDGNRHGHAFYLPEDADNDGCIDHLVVHAPLGFSPQARRALERLTLMWRRKGRKQGVEYQVVLEALGRSEQFEQGCSLIGPAREWVSATPWLSPWHFKKNRSVDGQVTKYVLKECRHRGMSEPESVELMPDIEIRGRSRRPLHFYRFRSKRVLTQPDTHGTFIQLRFAEPMQGPLALGFACHFGLGLFRPIS